VVQPFAAGFLVIMLAASLCRGDVLGGFASWLENHPLLHSPSHCSIKGRFVAQMRALV
jgi:hypothetical protein